MITFQNLLTRHDVAFNVDVNASPKKAFELLGRLAEQHFPDLNKTDVLNALLQRERLGSTYLGHGIAVPHARLASIDKPCALAVKLSGAINFETLHGEQPVDLLFCLLVPKEATDTQLKLLSTLTEKLIEEDYRKALRTAQTKEDFFFAAATTTQGERT